jgi:anti-sigma regulatory factor (Ser/Thr protein kinase)
MNGTSPIRPFIASSRPSADQKPRQARSSSLVAVGNFIRSVRESGYKSIATALAELIDNSLQARAKNIRVYIAEETKDSRTGMVIAVFDDGDGMSLEQIGTALQFGGTDRFDSRVGMGRFGMGLPMSSLSQARRVDVYSWRSLRQIAHGHLDVDEIVANGEKSTICSTWSPLPRWAPNSAGFWLR